MNDYLIALYYIILGLIGGGFHYIKKRYIDLTTDLSFKDYLFTNKRATIKTLFAIISAEVGLSLLHSGGVYLTLSELVGALTAGYTADSGLNSTKEEG
jgi:hypothetical protein